ncbi:polyphosphate kinase 1 [Chitinophaga sancti]|uniref:Polyphosphate kinase n=1 Tax=Chitinophaga sancti TaxID=1004 RepID=A0A1K1SXE9_9BACT|nr:polyphosphate kinase 1 [Chitinophaga sancti]WQD61105.1 polyphosphate kinase 1 [Chitinophaga sancti]WQG86766.1 polyphosphate kinase 1 [Chitinophaga sancti]SFW88533.1 polyphosphate kinase [Chitinophaga sancti]
MNTPLYDRDLSWLSFNYRVLSMAKDPAVPLYERIRFLSIFSSNLDEFFRVRMPAVMAVNKLVRENPDVAGEETLSTDTLPIIQQEINRQLGEFGATLTQQLLPALSDNRIDLYYNQEILPSHLAPMREYFQTKIQGFLQPFWLDQKKPKDAFLENNQLYLVVSLSPENEPDRLQYAVVNIPSSELPRFFELPQIKEVSYIVMLDDIIRENTGWLFPGYTVNGCYSIKITRDAETDMNELASDILDQVETMIAKRELGIPTRFLYDSNMPLALRQLLGNYFSIVPQEMVPGGRYHNLKDLADLPMPVKSPLFTYPKQPSAHLPQLDKVPHLLEEILRRDIILHPPYQRYEYILRFFNEAATDPTVKEIYITLYRIAASSQIANALISAARNGKQVTVFVELKARFDEANNIRWAKKMKAAGVKIIYSIPGLKVHAKIALVKRKCGYEWDYAGLMATGNFNESTARFYTDHVLLTAHPGITQELELLFLYLQARQQPDKYRYLKFNHLLVAQFNLKTRFSELIDREIANKKAGRPAHIIIKLNNLQEKDMIAKLYEASEAGVQVDLIARSICCLQPDQPESSNIRVRRIVDRYLEHARVFIFHNNGEEEVYMGSADWMNRNIHRRIEVCFPVYTKELAAQLKEIIRLQLADNTNAAKLDAQLHNIPLNPEKGTPAVNAQLGIYQYIQSLEHESI